MMFSLRSLLQLENAQDPHIIIPFLFLNFIGSGAKEEYNSDHQIIYSVLSIMDLGVEYIPEKEISFPLFPIGHQGIPIVFPEKSTSENLSYVDPTYAITDSFQLIGWGKPKPKPPEDTVDRAIKGYVNQSRSDELASEALQALGNPQKLAEIARKIAEENKRRGSN